MTTAFRITPGVVALTDADLTLVEGGGLIPDWVEKAIAQVAAKICTCIFSHPGEFLEGLQAGFNPTGR